jgi:hypothetical protein
MQDGEVKAVSRSTIWRTLKRLNITQKVMSRIHINSNPQDGVKFLERIAKTNPFDVIDVDETINDKDSFLLDFGFAPSGDYYILKFNFLPNNKKIY